MSEERKSGTVKWFDNAKGYGFIISPEGEDVEATKGGRRQKCPPRKFPIVTRRGADGYWPSSATRARISGTQVLVGP